MSDRLAELQRQRALAQEQLAWFDREIARETGQAPAKSAAPAAVPISVTPATATVDAATARSAEEIIAQYEKNPQSAAKDIKKGCYLYFAFALGMLVISAVGVYFVYTYLR